MKMAKYFGNILCVTYGELTGGESGEPVMSVSNYQSLRRRGSIVIARQAHGLGNEALIEWGSMPERFKTRYVAKYGDPEIKMSRSNEPLQMDNEAYMYFDKRILETGGVLSDELRDRYVTNASVLNRLLRNENDQRLGRGSGGNRTPVNWEGVQKECEMLREKYGHTLPKNIARLRDKMKEYKKVGYACLISGKLGNANTMKLSAGTAQGEWVIAQKRCRFPYKSSLDILAEYNVLAPSKGWKAISSVQTIDNFLNDPKVRHRWADVIEGELALRQQIQYQHDTQLPAVRDMLWYGDATKLNLYYKAFVNGQYKLATLSVYEVIDACSEVLLGYAVGKDENFQMMYRAYRNALEFAGHKPYENVTDGQGGTRRDEAKWFFGNLAMVSRYAAPYHGNSKTIEGIFGRLQSQVLRKMYNYTGGNITTTSDRSKVDLEFIETNLASLPTYEELIRMYEECRDTWNSMAHPNRQMFAGMSRMQVYLSTNNDAYAPALTEEMKQNIYMIPITEAAYTPAGLKFTVDGKEYSYTVKAEGSDRNPDLLWGRDNIGRRFEVHADPWHLGEPDSVVRLYEVTKGDKDKIRTFVKVATLKPVIHRAIGEQEEWEQEYIRSVERVVQELRTEASIEHHEMDVKYGNAPEQHGMITPQIKGINKRYEQMADKILAKRRAAASLVQNRPAEPEPAEVYPESIGQRKKKESYIDRM